MEGGRKCEWLMESRHFSNPSSTDIATSPLSQHQHQEKKPEMELFQVDDHESKTKPSTRARGSLRERSSLLQKVIQRR